MRASDLTKKKRRGGGRGRPAKNRKVLSRKIIAYPPLLEFTLNEILPHQIHRRLLGPQAWPLERMLAIFYAILPHPITSAVDIQTQVSVDPTSYFHQSKR